MEVQFSSEKLKKVLSDEKLITKYYGKQCGNLIMRRLSDLRNAANLGELRFLPGKWHSLSGPREGQWSAHLVEPHRLVMQAIGRQPSTEDENVDFESITKVKVIEVVNYH